MINKITLTADKPTSEVFSLEKPAPLLIHGNAGCIIERSVADSEFFPMTNERGDELMLPAVNASPVIYNNTLKVCSRHEKFRVSIDPAEVSATSKVTVIIGVGW